MFVGGDVSFNSRLVVYSDVSFNNRLFVAGDVSINQRLFVSGDVSMNGNVFIVKSTIQQGDVSLNQRLFVGGDVSFNSRLVVYSDVFLNRRLFIAGDLSINQRLFVVGDVSLNQRLFIGGDVSINQRLFVVGDASLNGNTTINGNLICNNYFKVNHIGENISLTPFVSGTPNTVAINYSTNNSLYLITGSITGNFTLNITGFPTDNNCSFTITLLIPYAFLCNVLTVNSSAKIILCSGSAIGSYSVTGSTFVVQSFGIINYSGTTANYAVTNISSYQ